MSRLRTRVPGRYERPANLRPPLGDRAAEADVRAKYADAVAIKTDLYRNGLAAGPRRVATVESATTMEHFDLVEATTGGVKPRKGKPAEITIDIIRSGWNTSGTRYYPAEVLERDIPLVYPASTHMHINHPSASESEDRPERSLLTLAAVFTDTPYAVREGDQTVMRVNARVYSRWREFLSEAHQDIGVSINGSGDGDYATREGREGLVLERLTHGQSVDFVTKPGAGGRIIALLESDRSAVTREAASLGAWLESRIHLGFTELGDDLYGDGRLTRDERIAASTAIGDALAAFVKAVEDKAPQLYTRDRWATPDGADKPTREAVTREATVELQRERIDRALQAAYGGEDRFAYLQDFDPDRGAVWFRAGGRDFNGRLWHQAYTRDDAGHVSLLGDRTEVVARTVYEPANAAPGGQVAIAEADSTTTQTPASSTPAGSTATTATTTAKEQTMTESVKDAATREAEEAVRTREAIELAQYRQAAKATPVLDAKLAESDLPATAQARIRAQFPATALPLVEADKSLDVAKFTTTVEAAITAETAYVQQVLESAGVGRVGGAGTTAGAGAGIPAGFGKVREPVATQEADKATTEALVTEYVGRGMSEQAARIAAAGRN